MTRLELDPRAQRDIRGLGRRDRAAVRRALERLAAGAENLDIKLLAGRAPWKRLRAGNHRVLFREAIAASGKPVILVARVVNRAHPERVVRGL